jgi:hypothetical protein
MLVVPAYFNKGGTSSGSSSDATRASDDDTVDRNADITAHVPFDRRVVQDDDDEPSYAIEDVIRRASVAVTSSPPTSIPSRTSSIAVVGGSPQSYGSPGSHSVGSHGSNDDHHLHGSNSNGEVLDIEWKNGYLERKSQLLQKWVTRFYILRERFIFSFKKTPTLNDVCLFEPLSLLTILTL